MDSRVARVFQGCHGRPSLDTVFRPLSCAFSRQHPGMPALISLLYGVAAVFGAAFAVIELRMLYRFLTNRADIRAGASAYDQEVRAADPAQGDLTPTVTIQMPLYNERTSAEQIVRAAAAQDYPRDRFDIQVLDDSTDETSEIVAAVVEEVQAEGVRIEHIRRGHRTGYKAGALSEGLERSDARFVALFDADFVPVTARRRARKRSRSSRHSREGSSRGRRPSLQPARSRWPPRAKRRQLRSSTSPRRLPTAQQRSARAQSVSLRERGYATPGPSPVD